MPLPNNNENENVRNNELSVETPVIVRINKGANGEITSEVIDDEYRDQKMVGAANDFLKDFTADDINDVKKLKKKYDEAVNKESLDIIKHRIEALEAVDKRFKHIEEDNKLSKVETVVEENDGTKKIKINQTQLQSTTNGCYSVAFSDMLRAKGVYVDQQTIRSILVDVDPNDRTYIADRERDLFAYAGFVEKLVPNTGMRRRSLSVDTELMKAVNNMNLKKYTYTSNEIQNDEALKAKFKGQYDDDIKQKIQEMKNAAEGPLKSDEEYTKEVLGTLFADDEKIKEFNLKLEYEEYPEKHRLQYDGYKALRSRNIEDDKKIADKFNEQLKKTVEDGLKAKSTIALNNGIHYITIKGHDDKGFFYYDPMKYDTEGKPRTRNEEKYITYEDFRNQLVERANRKSNDVINENQNAFVVSAVWLEDYQIEKVDGKAQCQKIDDLKIVKFDAGSNKCVPAENANSHTDAQNQIKYEKALDNPNVITVTDEKTGIIDSVYVPRNPIKDLEPYKSVDEFYSEKVYPGEPEKIIDAQMYKNAKYVDFVNGINDKIMTHGLLNGFSFTKTAPVPEDNENIEPPKPNFDPETLAFLAHIDKQSAGASLKSAILSVNSLKETIDKYNDAVLRNDGSLGHEMDREIAVKLTEIKVNLESYLQQASDKNSLLYHNAANFLGVINVAIKEKDTVNTELDQYKAVYAIQNEIKFYKNAKQEFENAKEKKDKARNNLLTATDKFENADKALKEVEKEAKSSVLGEKYVNANDNYLIKNDQLEQNKAKCEELRVSIVKTSEEINKIVDRQTSQNLLINQTEEEKKKDEEARKKLSEELAKYKKDSNKYENEQKELAKEVDKLQKELKEHKDNYDKEYKGKLDKAMLEVSKARVEYNKQQLEFKEADRNFNNKQTQYKIEQGTINKSLTEKGIINKIIDVKNKGVAEQAKTLLPMWQRLNASTAFYKLVDSDEFKKLKTTSKELYQMINPLFFEDNGPNEHRENVNIKNMFDENGSIKPEFKNKLEELKKASMDYIVHVTVDKNGQPMTPSSDYGKGRLQSAVNMFNFCKELEVKLKEREDVSKLTPEDLLDKADDIFKDNVTKAKSKLEAAPGKTMEELNDMHKADKVVEKHLLKADTVVYDNMDITNKKSNVMNFKQILGEYETAVEKKQAEINAKKVKKVEVNKDAPDKNGPENKGNALQ